MSIIVKNLLVKHATFLVEIYSYLLENDDTRDGKKSAKTTNILGSDSVGQNCSDGQSSILISGCKTRVL